MIPFLFPVAFREWLQRDSWGRDDLCWAASHCGYSVWLPQQEEREDVRFQGVVSQALLHLCEVSMVWELTDGRKNCIRSLLFLPSLPHGLWVEWLTFDRCPTLAFYLHPIPVLHLLIVLAVTDHLTNSPNWYLLDNGFSWHSIILLPKILWRENTMVMWKWFQDGGCYLVLSWFIQPQKIPEIRT